MGISPKIFLEIFENKNVLKENQIFFKTYIESNNLINKWNTISNINKLSLISLLLKLNTEKKILKNNSPLTTVDDNFHFDHTLQIVKNLFELSYSKEELLGKEALKTKLNNFLNSLLSEDIGIQMIEKTIINKLISEIKLFFQTNQFIVHEVQVKSLTNILLSCSNLNFIRKVNLKISDGNKYGRIRNNEISFSNFEMKLILLEATRIKDLDNKTKWLELDEYEKLNHRQNLLKTFIKTRRPREHIDFLKMLIDFSKQIKEYLLTESKENQPDIFNDYKKINELEIPILNSRQNFYLDECFNELDVSKWGIRQTDVIEDFQNKYNELINIGDYYYGRIKKMEILSKK